MRAAVALVLCLRAAALIAQPVVSDEVVSTPIGQPVFQFGQPVPAVAMAKDSRSVAIAWSMPDEAMIDRVYVARLDSTGHVSGEIHELPTATAGKIHAISPSIAPSNDGKGFVVAWLEGPNASLFRPVFCRLNGDLEPSLPWILANAVNTAPIVRTGDDTWITCDGRLWWASPAGFAVENPLPFVPTASDMFVFGKAVQSVGWLVSRAAMVCTCADNHSWGCPTQCQVFPTTYSLQMMTVNGGAVTSQPFPGGFALSAAPVLQSDGRDLLMVWFDSSAAQVLATRIAEPQPLDSIGSVLAPKMILGAVAGNVSTTVPSVATDGQRYVVVWRTLVPGNNNDVVGVAIDRSGTITPFSIATSTVDESNPSVIATQSGRFLVSYAKTTLGERRLAGRFVTFPGRTRVVR